MRVYYDTSRTYAEPRVHPYSAASDDQSGYVDFKARPELVELVLEDFKPYSDKKAVQTFYRFLKWINGLDSLLETNDCAFRPPNSHQDPNSEMALCAHGRVFVLYRDLNLNSSNEHAEWLCQRLMEVLRTQDPEFTSHQGVVGFTLNHAIQLAISQANELPGGMIDIAADDPGIGRHLMLSYWAYGNDEDQTFQNLERVFDNIWEATRITSGEIGDSMKQSRQR